jgi:squalene-hopene cyclase-like protein
LRAFKAKNVIDAAALLWGLADAEDADAIAQRKQCLALIRKGEAKDGGWGPYVSSAPETFDTAVVVLALNLQKDRDEHKQMLHRGRAFLLAAQQKDGSWTETTRPAGGDSYAQRVSTTGWATQALLATRSKSAAKR